jgi:hypothetical protein
MSAHGAHGTLESEGKCSMTEAKEKVMGSARHR